MKFKVLLLAALTLLIVQATQAQEQRRAKEGHNWSEWALKHPGWCDYHKKKVEFFNNHPDAAQRFLNQWYRDHPNEK